MVIIFNEMTGDIIAAIDADEYNGVPPAGASILIDSRRYTAKELLDMKVDCKTKRLRLKTEEELEREKNEKDEAIARFRSQHPHLYDVLSMRGGTV